MKKFINFKNAVNQLEIAVEEYKADNNPIIRDGTIQRFEFCMELAWKVLRDFMRSQYMNAALQFPKDVLREAYNAKLISEQSLWIDMLESRNLTSHIYSESVANDICKKIADKYLGEFKNLIETLENLI